MLAVLHGMSEVRLVDPGTGREFARLPSAGGPFCFSPDGSQLVTYAGRDGGLHVWDLRLIRQQLKEMDLDWDLPSYPSPSESGKPPHVKVLGGEPPPSSNALRAQAHLERGVLYAQLRDHHGYASNDFERALALDPPNPPWQEVIRAYSQVLERRPEDVDSHVMRALAYQRLDQWGQSIDDLSQAIKRAPQYLDRYLPLRAKAYLRSGQKEKAGEDYRKYCEGDPARMNALARQLATSPDPLDREPGLAVELARQAVRQAAPSQALYWNTLGVAHYRFGEWEAGVKAFEEAAKLASSEGLGYHGFFLAMCHHRLGDTGRARDEFDRAVGWYKQNEGKLTPQQRLESKAFRAEADALLGARVPPP
jgi:tetratricopeptide (TPR) repeat protein